eukprot:TRINITY_DN554_c5_g1_i1.p1 TRINITY_DN554_c5_g1~~TRINITY_DN554_c5_g1_i1.p1  ORF type:complete len:654 (+),score=135.93 TRINITY_DN554_c5_g1_i1:71-1963(+)
MDDLRHFVKNLEGSPDRAKIVLEQLQTSLRSLERDGSAGVFVDELPTIGVRVLDRLGCVESGDGRLSLPRNFSPAVLADALRQVEEMLQSVTRASAYKKVSASFVPVVAMGPAGEQGVAAARALRDAALRMSPGKTFSARASGTQPADAIVGATPTPLKRPGEPEKPPEISHKVPPAVQAVAQAVAQNMAQKYQQHLRGNGRSAVSRHPQDPPENQNGGRSVWCTAPNGMTPESRLAVDLPKSEFTYIERPWSHFVTRWAAIDVELEAAFAEDEEFSLVDLGSCMGFISLQAAVAYPRCVVVGIEGSVGVGNGTTGVQGTSDEIVQTKAVQTHLTWINKLQLPNCFVSPHVWDYERICGLAAIGRPITDVLVSLSVIHHIDNVSTEQYQAHGLTHVRGTVNLVAKLLQLAPRHFIELPDRPWMEHVHKAFKSPREFLETCAQATQLRWNFVGPLVISTWYGTRELWLLEDVGCKRGGAMPPQGLRALFPRTLGFRVGGGSSAASVPSAPQSRVRGGVDADLPLRDAAPAARSVVGRRGDRYSYASDSGRYGAPAMASAGYPQQQQQQPYHQRQMLSQGAVPLDAPLSQEDLGHALLTAPTALIAAHVQLREAMNVANSMLREVEPPEAVA